MDGASDADRGHDPVLRVQITPREYGRRSVVFIVGGVAVTAILIVLVTRFPNFHLPAGYGLVFVGYGIYCAVQARRQVTRTDLEIDRNGIRSRDGAYDRTWSGVVLVWVGASSGLRRRWVSTPVISLFTDVGVSFSRRAGTPLKALYTIPVSASWTVKGLCARLREITDASVVDGTQVSRRTAAAAVRAESATGEDGP